MHVTNVGRNEPCPCGSGRKFKKCCLDARDAALVGTNEDLDVVAIVENAISSDDWELVYQLVEPALALIQPMTPLEHVRFRHDVIGQRFESVDLGRLCVPGWLRWCEQEIVYVLDRHELAADQRDGLRMALHLLRRFGARSPIVEEIAKLQVQERVARSRRLADTAARAGLTADELASGVEESFAWLEANQPEILPFADWFALRAASEETAYEVWRSGTSTRVCDICLAMLDDPACVDRKHWARLACMTLFGNMPELAIVLSALAKPRTASEDERILVDAVTDQNSSDAAAGAFGRLVEATEAREDFAGAAIFRAAVRRIESRRNDP